MASRNPLPILLAAAVVPALALGGLVAVARAQADQPPPPPAGCADDLPPMGAYGAVAGTAGEVMPESARLRLRIICSADIAGWPPGFVTSGVCHGRLRLGGLADDLLRSVLWPQELAVESLMWLYATVMPIAPVCRANARGLYADLFGELGGADESLRSHGHHRSSMKVMPR